MPSLTILKAGLMTSIQDMGRKGLMYYALPNSGVMDEVNALRALDLLELPATQALLECTSIAPHIQFQDATQIALAGADFSWTLNEIPIPANGAINIQKGDVLKGKFAKNGLRAYIAINGTLKLERIYKSYATYTNAKIGGFKGRLLQAGDVLEWENRPRLTLSPTIMSDLLIIPQIPIHRGPEFDCLTATAKEILTSTFYQIGADSNRMGIRLKGKKLESSTYQLRHSLSVLPGFIQLPPSGLPIILLQDGQISGGYPRIAYVPERVLSQLNQIPIGKLFQFLLTA